jgi:L-rhamnose-H+ transport protein
VGLAQIFFGLALAVVGLSIGFAVTVGLSTAMGSIVPLILTQSSALGTARSRLVIAGVACTVVGTAICGVASSRKEEETRGTLSPNGSGNVTQTRRFAVGLLLCILAGVLSPLLNFGLVFGATLISRAAQLGVGPAHRANVIWPPLLTATLIPYLAYCAHLWRKNASWRRYGLPGTGHYWVLGTLMGVLWTGSLAIYGAASTRMQTMGPILGWPLFMSMIIISSNVWGFLTGEWRAASKKTVGIVLEGIIFLILGFCVLAWSSKVG